MIVKTRCHRNCKHASLAELTFLKCITRIAILIVPRHPHYLASLIEKNFVGKISKKQELLPAGYWLLSKSLCQNSTSSSWHHNLVKYYWILKKYGFFFKFLERSFRGIFARLSIFLCSKVIRKNITLWKW